MTPEEKSFVAWDTEGLGEGSGHRTVLLANSAGEELWNYDGVDWKDALNFLVSYEEKINVWFAFGYDVNMLFKSMPRVYRLQLFREGETKFELDGNAYHIKYIPRKILRITKNKKRYVHYDVWGFFQTSFEKTLEEWKIEVPHAIAQGKQLRKNDFDSWSIEQIKTYNAEECKLLVEVMNRLREKMSVASAATGINLVPRSWHGAGSIASLLLKTAKANEHKKFRPSKSLHQARLQAYFGGRIELFQRGYVPELWHYDINSAYPSAVRFLPSLRDKEFEFVTKNVVAKLEDDTFGLVHCKWDIDSRVGPLPFRLPNGYVVFPERGAGWYHWVEVQSALKKGFKIKIDSAWILPKPYYFFARDTIEKVAEKRLEFKRAKDLAHVPLKLGMNSLYGKLAQRPAKNHPPQFLELLYAGYVTAHCRAQILSAIDLQNVILIATDGVFSKTPLQLDISNRLGAWEGEKVFNGYFLLAGVYSYDVEKNGKLETVEKTRGSAKGEYTARTVYDVLSRGEIWTKKERRFIGAKLANTSEKYVDCGFQDVERKIDWNNNHKRGQFFDDGDSFPFVNVSEEESAPYDARNGNEFIGDDLSNEKENWD